MKVILDTNVLVAAFIAHGACHELLEHCAIRHDVVLSRFILDEFKGVLMAEGEPLEQAPSLAARLKVNPMTVSKAYGYLEQEGIVERRRGVGLFVAPVEKGARIRKKKEMLEGEIKRAAALRQALRFPAAPRLQPWNAGRVRDSAPRRNAHRALQVA